MARTKQQATCTLNFAKNFAAACQTFARCAARPEASSLILEVPTSLERCFILGWHFPEYPGLVTYATRQDMLCLLADSPIWLKHLADSGCTHVFRQSRNQLKLVRALKEGRPIYAMIDHIYPGSPSLTVSFLGYDTRVPSGPFELASRFGYQCSLLTMPREGRVKSISVPKGTAAEMAKTATDMLAAEILQIPSRWLMWPAVDQRWVDVDYDAALA